MALRKIISAMLLIGLFLSMKFIVAPIAQAEPYRTCDESGSDWQDVSGEWVASVGPVVFQVNGLNVSSIYNKDTWSLDLQYSPDRNHLFGKWSHRNGLEGPVYFHLNSTGCIEHARWGGVGTGICDHRDNSACKHDWAFHGRAVH